MIDALISGMPSFTDDTVPSSVSEATVIVIGAGQAGLSAAYHLQRRGFVSALGPETRAAAPAQPGEADGPRTFVVFDANARPGGAWQHRWPGLTMATVNGIFDLPGFRAPAVSPSTPSRDAVPAYFAEFEARFAPPILRPVDVRQVTRDGDGFLVETSRGRWRSSFLINATGTWNTPRLPHYPGQESFEGRQLHTRDFTSAADFAGQRVAVVGAGISAVQHLEALRAVATPLWYSRRPPQWRDAEFTPEMQGRAVIAAVTADVEAGRPSRSVVSYTGLPRTAATRAAFERGPMARRPMFTAILPHGVREVDASFTSVDVILWATGFRASLDHLAPLQLQNAEGGITMRGARVRDLPSLFFIGFGPTQSTVGANRAGREAVDAIVRDLDGAAG